MTLYIQSPFGRMLRAQRMMERMMGEDWERGEPEFAFPVDVRVEPEAYVISASLPGVKAEDLNITIINETVRIQGEVKVEDVEGQSFLLRERPGGRFSRTLTLPDPLDSSKADAALKDGILTLRVPKAEEAKPKTIKIVSH